MLLGFLAGYEYIFFTAQQRIARYTVSMQPCKQPENMSIDMIEAGSDESSGSAIELVAINQDITKSNCDNQQALAIEEKPSEPNIAASVQTEQVENVIENKEQQKIEQPTIVDKKDLPVAKSVISTVSSIPVEKAKKNVAARPVQKGSKRYPLFVWPIETGNFWLSSLYGPRKKPNGSWGFHFGIDMAATKRTPVRAVAGGVVTEADYLSGYGNTVVIKYNKIYKMRYAHLDAIFVKNRQRIKQGDLLGTVGDTGFTIKSGHDASHLHLEIYERGKQIDPLLFLPAR